MSGLNSITQPEPQGESCPGCEGTPSTGNSPCAVCGQLAQPEPQGAWEVKELVDWLNASAREWADLGEYDEGSKCHRAADILTRWGRPVIEPVAEVATPGEDYHEDLGPVLWWRFPVDEPPWCGSPNDSDWPGYHTHFTQLPAVPTLPVPQQQQQEVK